MRETVLLIEPLSQPWNGIDPFLFCAHHIDHYPAGDAEQGVPVGWLAGRPLGNDFSREDGFSMYHGTRVPGFPAHPHRGFETVTIVTQGLVDHSDSLGAAARYGDGDVQWLTAGKGVVHAEMFPLRSQDQPNPLHLFQIWLNLPASRKMVDPAFVMLWDAEIPVYRVANHAGSAARVKIIAGAYSPQEGRTTPIIPLSPPPNSLAADPEADLAIWQISLDPGASLTLPAAMRPLCRRALYFHTGSGLTVAGQALPAARRIELAAEQPAAMANTGDDTIELLLLQGVPLEEPVVARGPFVMNTPEEIETAFRDFRLTGFGNWPWRETGPVHPAGQLRFARHPDQSGIEIRENGK